MMDPEKDSDIQNFHRVLVVDDDASVRKLFIQLFKREKFLVDEACDGEMALEKIAGNQYDLILTDLHMQEVGGLDVLEAARHKDKHLQVLILTGFGSISSAVQAMKRGAFEYLSKPIDSESFMIKVRNALERRRMSQLLELQQHKLDQYHRMIDQDLSLAKQVQASLVPGYFENEQIAIAVEYLPMIGLGGDFADIYEDGKGRIFLTVIDVTGHGITAALLVNRVCSEVRKIVRDGLSPQEIIHSLNKFFCESFTHTGMFLTIITVRVDMKKRELCWAGSAHPAGLLWRRSKQQKLLLNSQNFIVGFELNDLENFSQDCLSLESGDRIILYTDGIVEAENDLEQPFGLHGLQTCLQKHARKAIAAASAETIKDIQAYAPSHLNDDILLMIAEIK
jgi:sigma-B regulation protein RsbU (phosphoserine phosphatase)